VRIGCGHSAKTGRIASKVHASVINQAFLFTSGHPSFVSLFHYDLWLLWVIQKNYYFLRRLFVGGW
jgi:hypothetical protein